VQRTLSRAPLGSIGKSLREVVVGVEARLQQLRENDSTTCGSSRPSTECRSSKSTAVNGSCGRGGPTAVGLPGHHRQDDLPPPHPSGGGGVSWSTRPVNGLQADHSAAPSQVSWDTSLFDCPASARDGYGGRPTTRDEARSGTAGIRPCTEGGRPATSDCWRQLGAGPCQTLDGTRPSTRDDMRLQQQLDGTRPSARDRKNGSRDVATPRRPSLGLEDGLRHRHPSCEGQRPTTRDGLRPPRTQERRCQDVTIRQVTGTRKRHNRQAPPDVLNLEGAYPERSPSPVPGLESIDAFGDESVELLE